MILRLGLSLGLWGEAGAPAEPASPARPDAQLPDYDCTRARVGEPQVLPWADWLAALEEGGREGGIFQRSAAALAALESAGARDRAAIECPVGLLMADVLRALLCYERDVLAGVDGCYGRFESHVRRGLAQIGFRVLMGSRWPVYGALDSFSWKNHEGRSLIGSPDYNDTRVIGLVCSEIPEPVLDWEQFKGTFDSPDWYQAAVDTSYGPELEVGWRRAAVECPVGFAVANLIKAMLCAHTESICFAAHETMLSAVVADVPLHLVAGSGWPVLRLLAHVARVVRRHGFGLDFSPSELLRAGVYGAVPAGAASTAMQQLRTQLPALRAEARLQAGSQTPGDATSLQLLYVTMAHGSRFGAYVGRFIERARALGLAGVLLVFCLDVQACEECKAASGKCLQGTPSIINKFTLPLVLMHEGFDVMWLDMDVFLFQAPTSFVVRQQREGAFDLLVSGSFSLDCVCTGIVFYRAVEPTRMWLQHLLVWMYTHPYEHDQKAFSAFLRAGERVAFDADLPIRPDEAPHWAFLDPATAFASARHVDSTGWTGDPDEIVAFHLLHGDSDDAAASRQFAARFALGVGYTPLLDVFFNRSDVPELYSTAVLPHRASPEIHDALWRSYRPPPRPTSRGRCTETLPMRF